MFVQDVHPSRLMFCPSREAAVEAAAFAPESTGTEEILDEELWDPALPSERRAEQLAAITRLYERRASRLRGLRARQSTAVEGTGQLLRSQDRVIASAESLEAAAAGDDALTVRIASLRHTSAPESQPPDLRQPQLSPEAAFQLPWSTERPATSRGPPQAAPWTVERSAPPFTLGACLRSRWLSPLFHFLFSGVSHVPHPLESPAECLSSLRHIGIVLARCVCYHTLIRALRPLAAARH